MSGAGARARAWNLSSGSAALLQADAVYDTENAFAKILTLAKFLRILSKLCKFGFNGHNRQTI